MQRESSWVAALTAVPAKLDFVGKALTNGSRVTNAVRTLDTFMVLYVYEVLDVAEVSFVVGMLDNASRLSAETSSYIPPVGHIVRHDVDLPYTCVHC